MTTLLRQRPPKQKRRRPMAAADLLACATGFSFDACPENAYPVDRERHYSSIDIVRMLQGDGRFLWAIRRDGMNSVCWTRNGEWEQEGMSSSRTDDYLARARWTFEEAVEEAQRIVPLHRERRRQEMEFLHAQDRERASQRAKDARAARVGA